MNKMEEGGVPHVVPDILVNKSADAHLMKDGTRIKVMLIRHARKPAPT